jgi:hypothetical protein
VKGARRGISLAELLVVMAIAGVIGGAVTVTLNRQQRFYRGAAELHYVRENVRDAMEVLSTDIRGMSVADTVRLGADSAIDFFANIGSSVVCQINGTDVGLPAVHASASSLSALLVEPDSGDIALFYARSERGGEEWQRRRIAGFGARALASSCPVASGMSQQSELDAGARGFVVTVASPLASDVRVGSPVRFVRRGRYSLYRASDGQWYLGYRRCNAEGAAACGAIQPVSGPYRPYSSDPPASGLLFEYFDANGQGLDPAASPLALARVDITARSESAHRLTLGVRSDRIMDSAKVSLAIRNGPR